ncbi:MAG: hypothetical protein WCP68_01690 [Enhydrobacter sp.]
MIGPLVRLAAASAAGRAIKSAAAEVSHRALLTMGAGFAGAVGIFCFSTAALTLMQQHMDPAAAWAAIGCFYGLLGCGFYFAAARRR